MSDWKLVNESKVPEGSSKIYQDSTGNVRIDSFNGDVRNPDNHDRFTLNTRNGGSVSSHGYGHTGAFDTSKSNTKSK